MPATPALTVSGLGKSYGDVRAVDGLSFHVDPGEVFALLGPNGAGKSTTVEILEGHRTRDVGTVEVLGYDPESASTAFRDRVGIVLQEVGIERELTVREVLAHYGSCYSRCRPVDEVLELVGLDGLGGRRTHRLSGGQKRRIDLALGLIGDPDLLFLDEPTTGFDPSARRQAWEMVDRLRTLGTTIVLTSHYMDEVQALADRVLVIAGGRAVAEGTPDELRRSMERGTLIRIRFPVKVDGTVEGLLGGLSGQARVLDGRLEIRTEEPTADLHQLTTWALDRGLELEDLEVVRPTLEDVYLGLLEGYPDSVDGDGAPTGPSDA
ncbi:MAG: ABC transporter ATP-binding protein [Acidimicrobiales bacterium]|nr:ABC transporter ATP-binding protein [Acidimicrobiales bacterium]